MYRFNKSLVLAAFDKTLPLVQRKDVFLLKRKPFLPLNEENADIFFVNQLSLEEIEKVKSTSTETLFARFHSKS